MRTLRRIILHCSATPPSWLANSSADRKLETIRGWHVNHRGWKDIGYHYIIDRDGTVKAGRPVAVTGAHVVGHNKDSIGICLIGGMWPNLEDSKPTDKFSDHFTPAQDFAARELIEFLQEEYGALTVHGHNDFAARGCPGFKVAEWFPLPNEAKKGCDNG